MSKERVIKEAKAYLEYAHEILGSASKNFSVSENMFITEAIKKAEISIKQLEILEEMMKVWKKTKNTKSDELEIGE